MTDSPKKMETFSIELIQKDLNNKETMDSFQEAMDSYRDAMVKHIRGIATELDISEDCAMDVWYLRSRGRWTEELETELIRLHKNGTPPNICDWL